jgi:hypothetical protein
MMAAWTSPPQLPNHAAPLLASCHSQRHSGPRRPRVLHLPHAGHHPARRRPAGTSRSALLAQQASGLTLAPAVRQLQRRSASWRSHSDGSGVGSPIASAPVTTPSTITSTRVQTRTRRGRGVPSQARPKQSAVVGQTVQAWSIMRHRYRCRFPKRGPHGPTMVSAASGNVCPRWWSYSEPAVGDALASRPAQRLVALGCTPTRRSSGFEGFTDRTFRALGLRCWSGL